MPTRTQSAGIAAVILHWAIKAFGPLYTVESQLDIDVDN